MWALVWEFWEVFHRVWGQNRAGAYDKRAWGELQRLAMEILRKCGLERRAAPRDPEHPEPLDLERTSRRR